MADQAHVADGEVVTSDETADVNAVAHEARLRYEADLSLYEAFARSVAGVLERCLEEKQIKPAVYNLSRKESG